MADKQKKDEDLEFSRHEGYLLMVDRSVYMNRMPAGGVPGTSLKTGK